MKDITVSVKTMKLLFFVGILCAFFIAAMHGHASWTCGGPYGGFWVAELDQANYLTIHDSIGKLQPFSGLGCPFWG